MLLHQGSCVMEHTECILQIQQSDGIKGIAADLEYVACDWRLKKKRCET